MKEKEIPIWDGKRHTIYAGTLEALREKEEQIIIDKRDGIKTEIRLVTVNDVFELWCDLKRGRKDNTFACLKLSKNDNLVIDKR